MPRSKNKKPQISLYLLFTIIAFLIITPIYLSQRYESKRTSPVGFKQEQIQDEAKDGVYTNYTYGFRFKYPEDKFKKNSEGWMVYEKNDGKQRILLSVTVRNKGPYSYRDSFEKIYMIDQNETIRIRHLDSTKLYSDDRGSYRILIEFTKTAEDAEIEHSIGYRASWLLPEDRTITINMFSESDSENFVLSNKSMFDQIVNSFEFINQ